MSLFPPTSATPQTPKAPITHPSCHSRKIQCCFSRKESWSSPVFRLDTNRAHRPLGCGDRGTQHGVRRDLLETARYVLTSFGSYPQLTGTTGGRHHHAHVAVCFHAVSPAVDIVHHARLLAPPEKDAWLQTQGRTGTEAQHEVRMRWSRNLSSPGARLGGTSAQLDRKTRRCVCARHYYQGEKGYGRRREQQSTPRQEERGELAPASYPRQRRALNATTPAPQ